MQSNGVFRRVLEFGILVGIAQAAIQTAVDLRWRYRTQCLR